MKNRQNCFGIIVLVSIIGFFSAGCGGTAGGSPSSIEIEGHKFVVGENKYKADLDYIINEMGLAANKVKQPNNGIVNSIALARQNQGIVIQYLDEKVSGPNSRVRVFELHYIYNEQQDNYILGAIKMYEFDDNTTHGAIADRALPIGEKLTAPVLIAKKDRKQTRFKGYVEGQKTEKGNISCEYIWTSDLEGVSCLVIQKTQ
jgi:hypothetical protein